MRIVNAYTITPQEIEVGDMMLFIVEAMVVRPGYYRLYRCSLETDSETPQGHRIINEREVCKAFFPTLALVAEPDEML